MDIIEAPKCEYTLNSDGSISTDGTYKAKISGTSFAAVLGLSMWDTPFTAACKLLGLYNENIDDKPAVKAGKALEPVILEHVRSMGVTPASELFAARVGAHDEWESDFDDDVYCGHIDAAMADGGIGEVKTTRAIEQWDGKVPMEYQLQTSLYAHFFNTDKIDFFVGVLTDKDLEDPSKWDVKNTYHFECKIRPDTSALVEQGRLWYAEYIAQGRTPIANLDDKRDKTVYEYLRAQQGVDNLSGVAEEYVALIERIDAAEASIAGERRRAEELKGALRQGMIVNSSDSLSVGAYTLKVQASKRVSYNYDAMRVDGIELDKYKETQTSYALICKKR